VRLERRTRALHHGWAAAAVLCAAATAGLAVGAGGEDVWIRLALGVLAIERCLAACRHRAPVSHAVVSGAVALMLLPDDARLDRTAVCAVGAVLLVVTAESAHVSRRLVTVAPVQRSPRDIAYVAALAAISGFGVVVTGAIGSIDAWAARGLLAGVAVTTGAFIWLARPEASGGAG
jgi:hypothetical protein